MIPPKREIVNNIMVFIKDLNDATLAMFNEKPAQVFSAGKTTSIVRCRINDRNYFEFIPNENLKPFAKQSV